MLTGTGETCVSQHEAVSQSWRKNVVNEATHSASRACWDIGWGFVHTFIRFLLARLRALTCVWDDAWSARASARPASDPRVDSRVTDPCEASRACYWTCAGFCDHSQRKNFWPYLKKQSCRFWKLNTYFYTELTHWKFKYLISNGCRKWRTPTTYVNQLEGQIMSLSSMQNIKTIYRKTI